MWHVLSVVDGRMSRAIAPNGATLRAVEDGMVEDGISYRIIDKSSAHPSYRFVLAEGRNRLGNVIRLTYRSEGEQPAGSRAIHVESAYGVLWTFDGASHGQWFATEQEARDRFDVLNID